jgi:HAD superfamily hydrolase (TIGR01450 family)
MRIDQPESTMVTRLVAEAQAPVANYDVALLDLDGVVYSGQGAVPGAVAALARARSAGMRLAFVTNNASRSPSAIAAHLTRIGVPAIAEDVVTSAQAAATLIAQRVPPGSPVLVAGAMGLRLALRARGLRPVSVAADNPVAVVQGYNPYLDYGLIAEAATAVRNGALFVASNTDLTIPTPRGLQPGNGSLIQVIVTATGVEPLVAGKPEPPLHREAVERTGARRPLVVGDRLDTDIEGAFRGGADSMLVLTGVSTPRDLVLASPEQRPAYIAADLSGLFEPQPVITPATGAAAVSCGGWTASREGAAKPIELAGEGNPVDGLRALCALAWSGGEVTAQIADEALRPLKTGLRPGR